MTIDLYTLYHATASICLFKYFVCRTSLVILIDVWASQSPLRKGVVFPLNEHWKMEEGDRPAKREKCLRAGGQICWFWTIFRSLLWEVHRLYACVDVHV